MPDERWDKWFKGQLRLLQDKPDTGFLILIYASVILERAARIELAMTPDDTFGGQPKFFDLLKRVVPELDNGDPEAPKNFWSLVRNGMAHDLAASKDEGFAVRLSRLAIKPDLSGIAKYDGDTLQVSPSRYAEAVINYVETQLTVAIFVAGNPTSGILALPQITVTNYQGIQTHMTESQKR